MLTRISLFLLLLLLPTSGFSQSAPAVPTLLDELYAYARIPAVTGREGEATAFLRERLAGLPVQTDALGNLVLVLGKGEPRRLLTAPLDEPGYIVSHIQPDGYLRLAPVGGSFRGPLAHQWLQGHPAVIQTGDGKWVDGALTVPSAHFERGARLEPERDKPSYRWQEAYVDVGATTPEEVAALGIRLLDPILPRKEISRLPGEQIAGPAMRAKAAGVALAAAARQLAAQPLKGTIVIAWTVLEGLNGKGLESVVNQYGPFSEAYVFSRCFEGATEEILPPAAAMLTDRPLPGGGAQVQHHTPCFVFASSDGPRWGATQPVYLGLPARYADSPAEMVRGADVQALVDGFLRCAGGRTNAAATVPPLGSTPKAMSTMAAEETDLSRHLRSLIERYGVSGAEGPVRAYIREQLPGWARPVEDEKGNLSVSFGQGSTHLVFVAHMDEVGFRVDSIRDDGRLVLGVRGGFLPWVWEGQAALVHVKGNTVPAVFEPRVDYRQTTQRSLPGPMTVYLGLDAKKAVEDLGIRAGATTVTMPKHFFRLGPNRAMARGFDDRVGCAALLLALHQIDPATIPVRVTFAWSVEEETGLTGAKKLAETFRDARLVFPIDTYVSSDDPTEPHNYGYCPLGDGPVLRVLESINLITAAQMQQVQALARRRGIPLQAGMTFGGTDGQPFLAYGIPSVPLSWPGRYSHSPVEVMDLRDAERLVSLIEAIVSDGMSDPPATGWTTSSLEATVDSLAAAPIQNGKAAGMAVGVAKGDAILLMKAYGNADLEFSTPMPVDARFEIGSVTKQFTAAAILQLAEAGKLSLSDDLHTYLPDFDTQGRRVTIAQLLNHTSGIKSYTELDAFETLSKEKRPRDTLLRVVEKAGFDFEPGTALIYNNTAFFLLGLIIEKTSGMTYEAYVQTHLFAPAGMDQSFYCREDTVLAHRAHGYDMNREGRLARAGYIDHTWPYAAGSLCSTVGDLIAWNRALHKEGKILSPNAYQLLITPGQLSDGTPLRYAQGIVHADIDGHTVLIHGGGIPGFLSDLRYYPAEDLTIVTLINSAGPVSPAGISSAIARSLLGEKLPEAMPFKGEVKAYAGVYRGRARGRDMEMEIQAADGKLHVLLNGRAQPPLQYAGKDTWRRHETGGVDQLLQFRKKDGRYAEAHLDLGFGHYVLQREGQ